MPRLPRVPRCPTCLRSQAGAIARRCWNCGKPIARHDKWILRRDGRMQHRFCTDTTAYMTKADYRKQYGHEPY